MLACSRLVLVSLLWVAAAIDPPKQPRVKQISEAEVPPGTKVKKLKEGEVLDLTGGEYERSKKGVSPEVQQMFDAIDTNDPATINAALGASIDINIRGPHGYTPLFLACVSHRLHAVRLLLDRSADVRRRNAQGFSPLDAAAFSGCAPCTRMLLEYGTKRGGVNLHYVHSDGFNALHRAIWGDEPGHTEVRGRDPSPRRLHQQSLYRARSPPLWIHSQPAKCMLSCACSDLLLAGRRAPLEGRALTHKASQRARPRPRQPH